MAITRNYYKSDVIKLKDKLVQAWCMCEYYHINNRQKDKIVESCIESLSYTILDLKTINLKSGNKADVAKEVLINKYQLNNPSKVRDIIKGSFKEKHIEDTFIELTSKAFAENINKLIECIGDDDYIVSDYIETAFNINDKC